MCDSLESLFCMHTRCLTFKLSPCRYTEMSFHLVVLYTAHCVSHMCLQTIQTKGVALPCESFITNIIIIVFFFLFVISGI